MIKHLIVGLLVGVCAAGVRVVYALVIGVRMEPPSTFAWGTAWGMLMIVLAVGAAPMCEEVFFRGTMLGAFSESGRRTWGIVVSAVLFAVMHFDLAMAPYLLAVGVIMAYVFLRTRSIVAPVVAHATANAGVLAAATWIAGV
ncbi:MAG: CPBP family intramembrane metalloprotease [Planctomycetes bacterium]|nr:CPBP family intramembrane metalloprotease [Planctomycetota bacterium]